VKNSRLFRKLKNGWYRHISRGVFSQMLLLCFAFLIVFLLIQSIFRIDTDLLFRELTQYDPEPYNENHPLKLFYIIGVIFFSGLLVMVLTNGIRNTIERIHAGDVRYSFDNHIIIFGYNDVAKGIIKSKYPSKILVVVEKNVTKVREDITGVLGKGVKIYIEHGSRTSSFDISSFDVDRAKEIHIIGEKEPDSDYKNLDCYNLMSKMPYACEWKANVYLYLQEPSSISLLCNRRYKQFSTNDLLDFNHRLKIYNADEKWARKIFVDSIFDSPEMNVHVRRHKEEWEQNTKTADYQVHLIIFGMSNTGEMVAKVAAQTCHYPQFIIKKIRTKITVIDEDFSKHRGILHGRYSDFLNMCRYSFKRIKDGKINLCDQHIPDRDQDFLDIEWEFIESAPDETALQTLLNQYGYAENELLTVVVCNADESANTNIALGLPKIYYDKSIPVWLYSKTKSTLGYYLEESRYSNIKQWGMLEESPEQILWDETWAPYLDYFYYRFDYINFVAPDFSSFNEYYDVKANWERCPVDVRMNDVSSLSGVPVMMYYMKNWMRSKKSVDVEEDCLDIFSELEHVRWVTTKLLDGYRPLDKKLRQNYTMIDPREKSSTRRELRKQFYHECIVPYQQLSEFDKQLDKALIKFYISLFDETEKERVSMLTP